ncbi:patatin-like phospholipase family protein [Thalassotalea sp. 1_MG-2023]|uniref:patatin-like phospholipase family protein n=1 Tax=Thalassotalea sp. 1_MG-2023 TaxID=3062680 RepID=UPI0026E2EB4C|nr:patatin-like phospholipase family protein [Thalassotalea sp. 1_MG-2023]MDO6425594.1 patatin-like phospholipase family protein [Thalassotalea sp. 1_MG-2023]
MNTQKIVPILAGGGTRLPAHVGILQALHEYDLDFDHIVGVSGGSIISSLYASGLSIAEIKHVALNTDYTKFRGYSLIKLLRNGGLSSGDVFERWIDRLLHGKTFKEMPFNLHIVATDVARGKPVIFNKENTPDLKVSLAVRFSMSIPLVFSFKTFDKHLMVDGSILSEDALHRDWANDGTPVVCFRLKGDYEYDDIKIKGMFPIVQYVSLLIRTFMTTISREYINEAFWHNTVVVNTGISSAVDFGMTLAQKEALYYKGYHTATKILPIKVKALSIDVNKTVKL